MFCFVYIKINFHILCINSRGPNKYTRNWEDLDAYSKPTRGRGLPGKSPKGRGSQRNLSEEEFPALSPFSKLGKFFVLNLFF